MKKTIKLLGLVLGCMAMFTACSDDNGSNPTANIAPSEFVLNTPAVAENYIELTDTTTISFTWSEPDFGYSALATYRFQVGVVQNDGTIKWESIKEMVASKKLSHTELLVNDGNIILQEEKKSALLPSDSTETSVAVNARMFLELVYSRMLSI